MLFSKVIDKDCGPVVSPAFVAGTASGGQRAAGRSRTPLFSKLGPPGARARRSVPDWTAYFTLPIKVGQLARGRFKHAAVRCTASEGSPVAAEALTYPAKAIFLLLWPIRRLSQDKDIVVRR